MPLTPTRDKFANLVLRQLQADGRESNTNIAERIGCTPGTVSKKVELLREMGVLTGFTCIANQERLYEGTITFTKVKLKAQNQHDEKGFVKLMKSIEEVLEIYKMVDSGDYLIKVLTDSNDDYDDFLTKKLNAVTNFERIDTMMTIGTLLRREPDISRAFRRTAAERERDQGVEGGKAKVGKRTRKEGRGR